MANIIVTNIPEKFTIEQVFTLLEESNIPCNNRSVKIIKSNRVQRESSSGRYCILNFDTDIIAKTAIEAINQIVLTVNSEEVYIRAMPFISNFKQLSQDPERNIVIYNLPKELGNQDLNEIFQDFGKVLSAVVKKGADSERPSMGYVLFDTKENAKKALDEADGKYLGPNKIMIKPFRTIEDRIENNCEVLLLSAGSSEAFSPEDARKRLKLLFTEIDIADDMDIFIKNDPRPEEINCGGAAWIFTLKTPEMAKKFIAEMNSKEYTFEDVKDFCKAVPKLSKGILAKTKIQQQTENRKKYSDSGASIEVFGLKKETTQDAVRDFFSKYGEIESLSAPTQSLDVSTDLYHLNILYKNSAQADEAISKASKEEAALPVRLADDGKDLRVSKYAARSDVKSTNKRENVKAQEVGPM